MEEALRDSKDGIETGAQAPKPVKIPREADFLTYTCERERGNLQKISSTYTTTRINDFILHGHRLIFSQAGYEHNQI